jgi:hypothetical protein
MTRIHQICSPLSRLGAVKMKKGPPKIKSLQATNTIFSASPPIKSTFDPPIPTRPG